MASSQLEADFAQLVHTYERWRSVREDDVGETRLTYHLRTFAKNENAIGIALFAVRSGRPSQRATAALLFQSLAERRYELADGIADTLVTGLQNENDTEVRECLYRAAASCPQIALGKELLTAFDEARNSPDATAAAVTSVGAITEHLELDPTSVERFMRRALGQFAPQIHEAATSALAERPEIDSPGLRQELHVALDNADPFVRRQAGEALAARDDERYFAWAEGLLTATNKWIPSVCDTAIKFRPSMAERILDAAQARTRMDDPASSTSALRLIERVSWALGTVEDDAVQACLTAHYEAPHPDTQIAATEALSTMPVDTPAVRRAFRTLLHGVSTQRAIGLYGLMVRGDHRYEPLLLQDLAAGPVSQKLLDAAAQSASSNVLDAVQAVDKGTVDADSITRAAVAIKANIERQLSAPPLLTL